MRSEFGKHNGNGLRPSVTPNPDEPLRLQQEERDQDGQSGLKPKNQFDPQIKFLPRPHLSGVSLGTMPDVTHPVKWLFSRKYRQKRREKKRLAKRQAEYSELKRKHRRNGDG